MRDIRVLLALERTLLAWVRTGIALIALGIVLAKFVLVLSQFGAAPGPGTVRLGILLVAAGAAIVFAAGFRFALHTRRVRAGAVVEASPLLGLVTVAIVVGIAIYAAATIIPRRG